MLKPLRFLAAAVFLCYAAPAVHAEFPLRDGDTVAFVGDSITAARGYTKIVEHYTLTRFPNRKVRFVNAGRGGDTASGCLTRLEKEVFSQGATVVTVAFGINDIGWGLKANDESKQRYLDGIRAIIEQCHARKIRVFICSAAITAEAPDKAEQSYLQKMCDAGLALAKSLGAGTIDLQRGMREVQRRIVDANAKEKDEKKHVRLHVADGIHLSDLGQLSMAYAMLKGLDAPADVSSLSLDAANGTVGNTEGCRGSDCKKLEDGIAFTREDEGLPMTLGPFSVFDFRWVPVHTGLARYLLTITNLPPGDYQITVEGRSLGRTNAGQLAKGINLTNMAGVPGEPGGPWDTQSLAVRELVDARDKLWNGARLRGETLSTQPSRTELAASERRLQDDVMTQQHALAKPFPYHFEVRKAPPTAGGDGKK